MIYVVFIVIAEINQKAFIKKHVNTYSKKLVEKKRLLPGSDLHILLLESLVGWLKMLIFLSLIIDKPSSLNSAANLLLFLASRFDSFTFD